MNTQNNTSTRGTVSRKSSRRLTLSSQSNSTSVGARPSLEGFQPSPQDTKQSVGKRLGDALKNGLSRLSGKKKEGSESAGKDNPHHTSPTNTGGTELAAQTLFQTVSTKMSNVVQSGVESTKKGIEDGNSLYSVEGTHAGLEAMSESSEGVTHSAEGAGEASENTASHTAEGSEGSSTMENVAHGLKLASGALMILHGACEG